MPKTDVSTTAMAIFFVAFAVTVLLTAGLVVGLPTTIQQAQATTSPSQADKHISEQGRLHQSERGAERSGVIDVDSLHCVVYTTTTGQHTACFSTQEECQGFTALLREGHPTLDPRIVEECREFEEPPAGAFCARFEEGSGATKIPCDEL